MVVFGKYRKKCCFLVASMLSLSALVSAMPWSCFSTCDADEKDICDNGDVCSQIKEDDTKSAMAKLASKEEVELSNHISCLCNRNKYSYHNIVLLIVVTGEKCTSGLNKEHSPFYNALHNYCHTT